jgi:hypothetical protein
MEISESLPCKSGTYMTEARAFSSGPKGQLPVWSLWAFGNTVSISCGS